MTAPSRDPEGVDATNRDYISYDQVDKQQSYRLAEAAGEEEFDDDYRIETCDIGRWLHGDAAGRRAFAAQLGGAMADIGFAVIDGHGVDPALYQRAEIAVERLFTDHTLQQKLAYGAQRQGAVNQGYFPIRETTDIHPDLVEGWVFCRRAFAIDDGLARPSAVEFWPDLEAEKALRAVAMAQEPLILPIMQSLLSYLGADPHSYDERLTGANFAMRLNYYPPISGDDGDSGAGRLLGHEDINLFTLLPAPRVEGLQVLNRRNFKWIRLQPPAGTIILNTGDYMQRISNDRLPSTTHRVSRPRQPDLAARSRVSLPMNVYLWEDELLEVLPGTVAAKYEPVKVLSFHTRTTAKYYGDDYAVDGGG